MADVSAQPARNSPTHRASSSHTDSKSPSTSNDLQHPPTAEAQPELRPTSSGSSEGSDLGDGAALNLSRYATNISASPVVDSIPGFASRQEQSLYTNGSRLNNQHSGHDDPSYPLKVDSVAPLPSSFSPREGPTSAHTNSSFPSTSSPYAVQSPPANYPPTSSPAGWGSQQTMRPRGDSNSAMNATDSSNPNSVPLATSRGERPSYSRAPPSHAYAPPRKPSQFVISSSRHRSSSTQPGRPNPDADYRAQKKAYAQRLQLDNADNGNISLNSESYPPSLGYSSGTDSEDESPSARDYVETDAYDQETMLYYGNDDMSPSEEELKIPANRERLEWHSMLANVLTGDVVRQEKKRMTGATEPLDKTLWTEVWLGLRAKVCGRTIPAQKRLIEDQRSRVPTMIEDIISFEIKGEAEAGKSAKAQVQDVVKNIEKCTSLYPNRLALEAAHPRAGSEPYRETCAALISWDNITALINTELGILKAWVGNEELDFQKPRESDSTNDNLRDDSSFIDRILKEDGLKSLQSEESSMLVGIGRVIEKAKATLIDNANAFANKHLPPYIEELLTLINFPSRLVQEIIRVRLSYANNIRDANVMMAEQMMSQFQILLTLAVKIKEAYMVVSQPEPGWDLPPCIDENFDQVVLNALKFYFKMLGWKLSANKNTFKEAEILEQEWGFSNALGRHFEGGDVEVAEQFSSLTSKSLWRLTSHFEKELQRRPNEVAGPDLDRRYKQILDSVRVRQRKLFRFSRLLTQTFENTTEFSINMPQHHLQEIVDSLLYSGHILVHPTLGGGDNLYIFASPAIVNQPTEISSLLGTCYWAEDRPREPESSPYLAILYPEHKLHWEGSVSKIDIRLPKFDIKPGKLRLVAEGSQQLLQNTQNLFIDAINTDLDITIPQRANLSSVDHQLQRIKRTAYKLSNTIMDSVEIIRRQLDGLDCQELIQTCFAFATEFGQRSVLYMDHNRRQLNNLRLTRLALDWVSFICDDCIASDRKTFRWTVVALEFAMVMTRGQNILVISDEEYAKLRTKVAGCMSLLISHFDIMGARSTVAAQAEKQRMMDQAGSSLRLDISKLKDDEESAKVVRQQWLEQLSEIDELRKSKEAERQALGRVLEASNEADRSLTFLSSSATNVTLRWQQGQYIGGGTFGSVYAAINLDSNHLMAVKEIRLQDPQLIPTIASQIRDEMNVLQILDHPNIVSYYGIEVHRDKVYIFMEYCSGGSLAGLLEHGRIEDETVITVYALQMLEGLAYLHESGVIHRDIKPENILLDDNGVIKYVDFGAAKVIAKQTGRTLAADHPPGAVVREGGRLKSMTGTPMYMSPEVINPDAVRTFASSASSPTTPGTSTNSSSGSVGSGPRPRPGAVDTWSLGCVVLEMATGRRPWASLDNEWAIMYNIAQGNPPQLPSKEQLSESGIDFLKRCFERDPCKRASAAELLQHDWIMALRNQLNIDPAGSSSGGNQGSMIGGGGMVQTPTSELTPGSGGSSRSDSYITSPPASS